MFRVAATALLFATLIAAGCRIEAPRESTSQLNVPESMDSARSDSPGSSERVAIVDRGFQMTRGTQEIPAGWLLTQNIATDPNTGRVVRNELEIQGTRGELITSLGMAQYAEMFGTHFAGVLHDLVMQRLGAEFSDISLDELRRSSVFEGTPEFRKADRFAQQSGMRVQGLEMPVRATKNGEPVRGVVYVGHFTAPSMPGAGTIQVSAVMSPPERLEEAVKVNESIAHSYSANPQFEQRLAQVHAAAMQRSNAEHQQRMAASQAQHQQRMANNQARFESHQRMMQGRYDAADQQHQQWMNDFRSSGTSAWQGSDYTSHDALIDGIHERSSFNDPYSGQQLSRDGQYDYWYQNNLGEYYGTNDPSFDPHALQGNWQQIDPLTPNP